MQLPRRTNLPSILFVLCAACAPSPDAEKTRGSADEDAGGDGDKADADDADDEGADVASCEDGNTRSCNCAKGGSGEQTCHAGAYGDCVDCDVAAPACMPGRYTGKFAVVYWPGADSWWPGVLGPFASENNESISDFDLVKNDVGEFYTLGDACIRSQQAESADLKPAISELTADFDCASGKLSGTVRGYYAVRDPNSGTWTNYYYKGPLSADYDPETQTFTGTYDIKEPPVLFGEQPGGRGMFEVTYDPGAQVAAGPAKDCLEGVDFPDEKFP